MTTKKIESPDVLLALCVVAVLLLGFVVIGWRP